jgi:hypothetical protein
MLTHHAPPQGDPDDPDDLLTSFEAGAILQRAPDTVRLLARRGLLIPAIETRAGRLFRRRDVEDLAARRRAPKHDQRERV